MSQRRYNTVHDLAALRLHPDGSRVSTSSSRNLRPRGAKHSIQDARGNWIADDAGGSGQVQKRRRKGKRKRGEDDLEDSYVGEEDIVNGEANVDARKKNVKTREAKKRREFLDDFDFLAPTTRDKLPGPRPSEAGSSTLVEPTVEPGGANAAAAASSIPLPSSDLLKAIHHFATEFYTERGQLIDAGRTERRIRKQRRLARLQALAVVENSSRGLAIGSNQNDLSEDGSDAGEDGTSSSERSSEDPEEMTQDQYVAYKSKADARRAEERARPRDMYKAFEGSALVAIGMLVEAHVASLLQLQPPMDWVEQEEAVGSEVESLAALIKTGRKRGRKAKKQTQIVEVSNAEHDESDLEGDDEFQVVNNMVQDHTDPEDEGDQHVTEKGDFESNSSE